MKEQDLFNNAEYLLSLALKKTNNYEQAEDLVSETLISALASLKDGKSIDNLKAYLSAILNHKFNDFLRSKYSKPTIYYGVIPEYDFASNEKSAEDQLIQKEEAEKVRQIISQLSKNYREVLVRHFIHGQNVGFIADDLKINVNTVKSRLNTARITVKKQMENDSMEKYEKQSYEPEQLDIWMYGDMEEGCNAFYINDWTRRIHQNILILAYKKPVTISEISEGLGISAAYIEPIVEELISYDFMARSGDKVYTSFIIFSEEEKNKAYDNDKAIAEKYAKPMWLELEKYLEQIRKTECYSKMSKRQQASLIQFAAIFIIHEAMRQVKTDKIPKADVMSKKHNSGWTGCAYGFNKPLDSKPDWDYVKGHSLCKLNGCNVISTGLYKNLSDLKYMAYDVVAGFTFGQFWPLSGSQFLKTAYALYAEEEADIPLIAPKFFETIDKYCEYNLLSKEPDPENPDENSSIVVLNIPVLTAEESEEIFGNIIHNSILDFSSKFKNELCELFVDPVKPPKHLSELVPEELMYQLCGDAFVMALIYQGAWNGYYNCLYPIGKERVPGMVILLGNRLTDEELKNPEMFVKKIVSKN